MRTLYHNWQKRRRMRRFYRGLVPVNGLCFDVGANHGRYCELFFRLGARVVAVEPQKHCFEELVARYNGTDRGVFYRAALGATSGMAKLFLANIDEVCTLSNEFIEAYGRSGVIRWNGEEDVDVVTLDELIEKWGIPAFCKLDIEGWEAEALKGLSQALPLMSIEYVVLLKDKALLCIDMLERLGPTKFNFSAYEECRFRLPEWLDAAKFKEWMSALPSEVLHGDMFARQED